MCTSACVRFVAALSSTSVTLTLEFKPESQGTPGHRRSLPRHFPWSRALHHPPRRRQRPRARSCAVTGMHQSKERPLGRVRGERHSRTGCPPERPGLLIQPDLWPLEGWLGMELITNSQGFHQPHPHALHKNSGPEHIGRTHPKPMGMEPRCSGPLGWAFLHGVLNFPPFGLFHVPF